MNAYLRDPEFIAADAHAATQLQLADHAKHHPEDRELHPLFASILQLHAKPFQARYGKQPRFATSHAAVQYERGYKEYADHRNTPPGLPCGPRYEGYLDAKNDLDAKVGHRTSDWAELSE